MATDPHQHPPATPEDLEKRLEASRQKCHDLEEQAKQLKEESEQRRQERTERGQ